MCWWLSRSHRTPLPRPVRSTGAVRARARAPGTSAETRLPPGQGDLSGDVPPLSVFLGPRSRHDLVNATAQVLQAARGPRVGREYSPFLRAHRLAAWPIARAEGRRPSHTGDEALDRHWPVTAGHQLSEPAGCDSRRAAADYACAQPATPSP
jgi:hypothetical protein